VKTADTPKYFTLRRKIAGEMREVVTHHGSHVDELWALQLAIEFATPSFIKKHCPDGKLYLGIEGSAFDEHPRNGGEGKEEHCCATLMAKALEEAGLLTTAEHRRAHQHVMQYVLRDDTSGGHPMELGTVLIALYKQMADRPIEVVHWALDGFAAKFRNPKGDFTLQTIGNAMYQRGPRYYEHALRWMGIGFDALAAKQSAFEQALLDLDNGGAAIWTEIDHRRDSIKVAVVRSDNWRMNGACRYRGAGLTIVRQRVGTTQIFTNRMNPVNLGKVALALNVLEAKIRGYDGKHLADVIEMGGRPGSVPGGLWYYDPALNAIMNGSLTYIVEPTRIPLGFVARAVMDNVL